MKNVVMILGLSLLAGCAGSRHVDVAGKPSLSDIVDHIQCEVYNAWSYHRDNPQVLSEEWVSAVTLTLSEKTTGSLAPSASIGDLRVDPRSSPTYGVGLGLSKSQTDVESYSFVIDISKLDRGVCGQKKPNGVIVGGDIGIKGVVDSALQALKYNPYSKSLHFTEEKNFGKSITVVLSRGVSPSGVQWTLSRFAGPGNFFSFNQESTDTIDISFAKAKTASPGKKAHGDENARKDAAKRASDYNTKIQLQRLILPDNL